MRPQQILFLILFSAISLCLSCNGNNNGGPEGEPNEPPGLPYNPFPAHLSTDQSREPFFSWSCEDQDGDALTYEMSLLQGDVEIFNSGSISDTFVYYSETLDENTEYKWKITSNDGVWDTSRIEYWRFTTGTGTNNPPLPSYNLNPHGIGHPLAVTIEWECVDPDGDALTYDVWFSEALTPLALIGDDQSDSYLDVDGLSYSTIYIYQIETFDPHGGSSISHISNFSTEAGTLPDPPFDPNPADDRNDVSVDTTLSWSGNHPGGLPLTYDVYFGPAGATPPPVSTGQAATQYTPPTLEYGTEYEWQVVAEDNLSNRTEGPLWSFTTEDEPPPPEGIYAQLILGRRQTYNEFDQTLTRNDWISARFDSAYAPDGPITPLRSSSVICGTPSGFDVPWVPGMNMHYYNDIYAGYFLTPGVEYTYSIKEGEGVPAITEAITLPACTPYIISPEAFSNVPRSGFELTWTGSCGGTVAITIIDLGAIDSTGIYITTEDDGAYTFTADDLSAIDPFVYQIQVVLITENRHAIIDPGYDPRSFISARILGNQFLYLDP